MSGKSPIAGKGRGKKTAAGSVHGTHKPPRMELGINPALMVTVEEACRMLGIGHKVLYRLMNQGEIEFRHLGRYRRIPVWSLEDFAGVPLDRRRSAAGAAGAA